MGDAEKVIAIAEVLHARFPNLTVKETNELALRILKVVNLQPEVDPDDIPF